jgi:hypothetical protein
MDPFDPRHALNLIHAELSGVMWSPDTLDAIAQILVDAGYTIDAPEEA